MTVENLSMEEIQAKLAEPFKEDEVEWRVMRSFKAKNGNAFAYAFVAPYVESRAIMHRLDEVIGAGNWENDFKEIHNGILCGIRIHFPNGKTITKWDGADPTDFESTKGGISNASKRAAVQWGIGRYLYEIKENMVEIYSDTKKGKNYIKDKKQGITGSWNPPRLSNVALPSNNKPGRKNDQNQDDRNKLNRYISKFEMEIGLNQNPEYIVRIFNKATNSQIQGVNYVRNASIEELTAYYRALKPVYQLVQIRKKYQLAENEFIKLVQTYVVETEITSLSNCFFNVNDNQIKQIETLARDTYNQRQKAS